MFKFNFLSFGIVLFFILLCSCAAEMSDADDDAKALEQAEIFIAEGCEDIMIADEDPSAKAMPGDEARLAVAIANPDVEFGFTLRLRKGESNGDGFDYLDDEEKAERNKCLEAALKEAGFENQTIGAVQMVTLQTSYNQVKPFLKLHTIEGSWVSCNNDTELCDCSKLSIDDCMAHAFCWVIEAKPYDTENECFGTKEPVGCTISEACTADVDTLESPDGKCWFFTSGCRPDSGDWKSSYNIGVCEGLANADYCR